MRASLPCSAAAYRKDGGEDVARLIATGNAPEDECFVAGQVFDVPAYADAYDLILANGWAVPYPEGTDPGVDVVQVANAMVRGDALLTPAEQAIASAIGTAAHGIVAAQESSLEVVGAVPGVQTSSDSPELDRGKADAVLGVGATPTVAEAEVVAGASDEAAEKPAAAPKPRSTSRKKAS